MVKSKPELRVLCQQCHSDYFETGYRLKPTFSRSTKEPCTRCGRDGWEYELL